MFPRAFRIARLGGVDVRIDPTWVVIAVLVVWSFASQFADGERSGLVALVMAVAAAVGFFGSVLAHELGHALEARHLDLEVHGITLFVFGGVTEMDMRARRPRDEFTVAAIGPYTSLVLAALFGLVTTGIDEYVPDLADVSAVTGLLGWINLGLAVFNLVPGAPLDGGRVLRAALWRLTGDRHRAAVMASRAGQTVAVLLWLAGLALVITTPSALFSALWFGFIGWFMFTAAQRERAQAEMLAIVEGRHAGDLVTGEVPTLPPDLPLASVEAQLTANPEDDVYPVVVPVDGGWRIIGAVTTAAIEAVDPFDRGFRTVRDVMIAAEDLPHVTVDAPVLDVLHELHDHEVVGVGHGDQLLGVVDRHRANAAVRRFRRMHRTDGRRGPADSPDVSPLPEDPS